MGHITQDHLQQSAIAIPDNKDIADRFEELISPIFNQIIKLHEEILNLTKQRDKLLPLLMNGQALVKFLDLSVCINLIIRTTTRICSYPNDLFLELPAYSFSFENYGQLALRASGTSVYMPLPSSSGLRPSQRRSESELPPPPPEETGIGCPLMSASATAKIILRTEGIASWPSNVFSSDSIFRLCLKEFYSPVSTDTVLRNLPDIALGGFDLSAASFLYRDSILRTISVNCLEIDRF